MSAKMSVTMRRFRPEVFRTILVLFVVATVALTFLDYFVYPNRTALSSLLANAACSALIILGVLASLLLSVELGRRFKGLRFLLASEMFFVPQKEQEREP